MSLVEMATDRHGTVLAVEGGRALTARLDVMGIRPGVTLVKVSGSYLRGPVTVRLGNARLAIGFGMASKVVVGLKEEAEEPG